MIDLTSYQDRLIAFEEETYVWQDPWGRNRVERALRVRAIYRPTQDETIRLTCQHYTIDPGYPDSKYVTYGYTIPNLGTVKRMTNVVDYTGGSWWAGVRQGYKLHDKSTITREQMPLLDMWGRPTTKERLFP
jgi:hypothetical protein